jgi:hypothetical protein
MAQVRACRVYLASAVARTYTDMTDGSHGMGDLVCRRLQLLSTGGTICVMLCRVEPMEAGSGHEI